MEGKQDVERTCLFCDRTDVGSGTWQKNFLGENSEDDVCVKTEPEEVEVDKEPLNELLEPECSEPSCDLLSSAALRSQLVTVFVVRKLLKLPEEKCAEYLARNGGVGNPSDWFSVCAECGEKVGEAYRVFREIKGLQGRLERMQKELKDLIWKSNGKPKTSQRRSKGKREKESISADIRNQIVSEYGRSGNSMNQPERKLRGRKVTVVRVGFSSLNSTVEDISGVPKNKSWRCEPESSNDDIILDVENGSDSEWEAERELIKPKTKGENRPKTTKGRKRMSIKDFQDEVASIQEDVGNCSLLPERKMVIQSYKCDQCVASYHDENKLKTHLNLHRKKEGAVCPLCGWLCLVRTIRTHMSKHKRKQRYKCDLCPAVLSTELMLKRHQKVHGQRLTTPCPLCGWLCLTKNLKRHLKRHRNNKESSTTKRNLWEGGKQKNYRHFGYLVTDELPFYCGDCHMIFTTPQIMLNHRKLYHADVPLLFCGICNESGFETKQFLGMHMKNQHPGEHAEPSEDQPQKCPHCAEQFETVLKRDYHIAKHHKDKLLTCQTCGFKARKFAYYAEHQQVKHQYKCKYCPILFRSEKYRSFHEATQHAEKRKPIKNPCKLKSIRKDRVPKVEHQQKLKSAGKKKLTFTLRIKKDKNSTDGQEVNDQSDQTQTVNPSHQNEKNDCIQVPEQTNDPDPDGLLPLNEFWDSPDAGRIDSPVNTNCDSDYDWKPPKGMDEGTNGELMDDDRDVNRKPRKQSRKGKSYSTRKKKEIVIKTQGITGKLRSQALADKLRTKYRTSKRGRKKKTVEGQLHKERIPFYCDECPMIVTTAYLVIKHKKLHHPLSPFSSCTFCDATDFETKQLLELHCKEKHPDTVTGSGKVPVEEPQLCPHCQETFPSKLKKDFHIAKEHKDKLNTCQICGFVAPNYKCLMIHVNRNHQKGNFMCELCSRYFNCNQNLKRHKATEHHVELGLEPPETCAICNVKFVSKGQMRNHMKFVHEKVKLACCEYCGKAFSRPCDMKRHILLHTAPREEQYKPGPFFCEFCPGKFNVRQGLYYHMKREHSDKYSFKCEFCGTGYATQYTLLQHNKKCKMRTS